MIGRQGILQRTGYVLLTHYVFKTLGTVFAGRNDKIAQASQKYDCLPEKGTRERREVFNTRAAGTCLGKMK